MLAAELIELTAPWVTLVSGLVIPLITGLVTKLDSSVGKKSLVTVVLALLAGLLASVVNSDGVVTTELLLDSLITWGLALGAYYGLYSPFNTDAALLPDKGI